MDKLIQYEEKRKQEQQAPHGDDLGRNRKMSKPSPEEHMKKIKKNSRGKQTTLKGKQGLKGKTDKGCKVCLRDSQKHLFVLWCNHRQGGKTSICPECLKKYPQRLEECWCCREPLLKTPESPPQPTVTLGDVEKTDDFEVIQWVGSSPLVHHKGKAYICYDNRAEVPIEDHFKEEEECSKEIIAYVQKYPVIAKMYNGGECGRLDWANPNLKLDDYGFLGDIGNHDGAKTLSTTDTFPEEVWNRLFRENKTKLNVKALYNSPESGVSPKNPRFCILYAGAPSQSTNSPVATAPRLAARVCSFRMTAKTKRA